MQTQGHSHGHSPAIQAPDGRSPQITDGGRPPARKKEVIPRVRRKPDAILVSVVHPQTYIEAYRTLMTTGRASLKGVVAVKKTRLGHILLELEKGADTEAMAEELRKVTEESLVIGTLRDKTALEVKEVCPLADAEGLAEDVGKALKISPRLVKVRILRMGPLGTQRAVVEVPTNALKAPVEGLRFSSGISSARLRPLQKSTRCFKCHTLGHIARDCTIVPEGSERCRRCGDTGHEIAACRKYPKCIICSNNGVMGRKAAHVTNSLACPSNKRGKVAEGRLNKGKDA